MPSGYWGGLVEGFQGRRDEEYARNQAADTASRAQEGKIFEYLLNSRDPEMQALALSGLFESAQPGTRKGGLRGFMGEVQGGSFYPMIRDRMNEMVPDTGQGGGPAPPQAGSAAMSTNQTTRPGSQPLQLPPQAPTSIEQPPDFMGPPSPVAQASLGPQSTPGMPMPPPGPPPESKWKRRGTGVPTAEEIAESNGAAGIRGRVQAITAELQRVGAPPESIQRAILGIAGAPPPLDTTASGPVMADPLDPETPIPTIRHRDGTVTLIDGSPVPPGYVGYARPTSAGMATKTIRDPQSPSGYSAVTYDPQGNETRRVPVEYSPPPVFAGTGTILDSSNNPTFVGVPRGGGAPVPIGSAPSPQPSSEQSSAQALLADVQARIATEETPRLAGQPKRPLLPARRDALVKEAAIAAGLPYQTYFELEQATRIPPARQVTPRAGAPAGTGTAQPPVSAADRIRERALQIQQGRQQEPTAPPVGPPPAPSRSRGAGPGPRR